MDVRASERLAAAETIHISTSANDFGAVVFYEPARSDLSSTKFKISTGPAAAPGDETNHPQALGDAIGDTTGTAATLGINTTFTSLIDANGDLDYFRISLVAGQTYTFSLEKTSWSSGLDCYLELRDGSGLLIDEDDDGGIFINSQLTFTATSTGDFYLVARAFGNASSGAYAITTNTLEIGNTSPTQFTPNGKTMYSWEQAAFQIHRDFQTADDPNWIWPGDQASWSPRYETPVVVTYAFRSTTPATMPEDTAGFSRFNSAQIAAAQASFAAWAAVANVVFIRVDDGDGYSNNATILLGNYSSGASAAAAFAYTPTFGDTTPAGVDGDVWVNVSLSYNANPVIGGYGAHALLHEIGHAIGLNHPGDYNAAPGVSITYANNAEYYNDSRMFTVMSYFSSSETGANLNGLYASLPQLHDIAAIQHLYGANMATRTGNTIYGFNSNTGVPEYSLTLPSQTAIFSIWDAGGNDTLDMSGYSSANLIDLREEAFSNVGGSIYNISIARGAVIENAIGGSGVDTITGNAANNGFTGNGANDVINGGLGVDTSNYSIASTGGNWHRNPNGSWSVTATGAGTDTLTSVEVAHFSDRNVVLDLAQDTFYGNGASDLLWRNVSSGAVAMWEVMGATQLSAAIAGGAPAEWSIVGTGDLNGDGKDDLLWRNTNDGGVALWEQNGASSLLQQMIGGAPLNWVISGVGDFNFDGKDDLVWRNTSDGGVAVWLQNGTSSISQTMIGGAPLDWSIVAVADFDGDGKDDLLWRHAGDGVIARWVTDGSGNAGTSASIVGSRPSNWIVAGTGDFDGDGRADILWRNSTDGAAAIWLMDGSVRTGGGSIGAAPTDWSIAQVGDYNGDGKDDILWRHDSDGLLVFWQMNGANVTSQTTYGIVPTDWHLV